MATGDSTRESKVLSAGEREEIQRELANSPTGQAASIEALMIVQRHRGWVPDEALPEVGELLGMSVDELEAVATFYSLIFRRPVGRHVILLCDSISCWLMGYEEIRAELEERLGIVAGQTTADGRFTLLTIPCLGCSDHAPAMMVDEDLHWELTVAGLDDILGRYE
jgi:NADH-quinone oxidoreductase subunit E